MASSVTYLQGKHEEVCLTPEPMEKARHMVCAHNPKAMEVKAEAFKGSLASKLA